MLKLPERLQVEITSTQRAVTLLPGSRTRSGEYTESKRLTCFIVPKGLHLRLVDGKGAEPIRYSFGSGAKPRSAAE
jgi:hypothetical protein